MQIFRDQVLKVTETGVATQGVATQGVTTHHFHLQASYVQLHLHQLQTEARVLRRWNSLLRTRT